jgi:hypothetical protein
LVKRISHKNAETKATFMDRASSVINFVISQGGTVQKDGRSGPGTQIREGTSMGITTWNNFNTRLRQTGIFEYETEYPGSRRIKKISFNRQRIIDLAEVGDLPRDLIEAIEALDELPEPQASASASGGDPDFLA